MGTIAPFQIGEAASASKLMGNFKALRSQGQAIIDALVNLKTMSMIDLEQQIEALNARRQRANRTPAPFVVVSFVASDLLDIDQSTTSATLRPDAQAFTLKERPAPTSAVVLSQQFVTSSGVAEALSSDSTLYRVSVSNRTVPTGTFNLQLTETLSLAVLSFDLAAMPSAPVITVSASSDGVNYVAAVATSLNGERLTAWLTPMGIRYITVSLTPAAPDTLGGNSYTFGLNGFSGSETEFELQSDLYTMPIRFAPRGMDLKFVGSDNPGLTHFLNFNENGWQEVSAGATVSIPGTSRCVVANLGMNSLGLLNQPLPDDVYPGSLMAVDDSTGEEIPVICGLSAADPKIGQLVNNYLAADGTAVSFVGPDLASSSGRTFTLSYVTGPLSVSVQLKVQLSTSDRTVTPTFVGANLQEL